MSIDLISRISGKTTISSRQIASVLKLLDEGCTIPFIARYRKEATGSLDEVQLADIRDLMEYYGQLDKRKESVLGSLTERELLTEQLRRAIEEADTFTMLEDLYLPYRQKRRTRADAAKEAGLGPLAVWMHRKGRVQMRLSREELEREAAGYLKPEKKIESVEDALGGARDILAEQFNEDAAVRRRLRTLFSQESELTSRVSPGKEKPREAADYRDYHHWQEPAAAAPSHRILAIFRGSDQGILTVHTLPDEERALRRCVKMVFDRGFPDDNAAALQIERAVRECYKRLTAPSLELALKKELKQRADREAVKIFSENLRGLLLAPPMGEKRILAVDPGLRTGCKIVCLSGQGDLLEHGVIYPLVPFRQTAASRRSVLELCRKHGIEAIAVGNGTGGRECQEFLRSVFAETESPSIPVIMVNESGASIYSASHIAREEFPDEDITVRGAVSIGRRLLDPLAELVKIDPKSIGVGQYQHDVDQKLLRESLREVVSSCVHAVGVELNTASRELLGYVSGLTPRLADAVCTHREQNGPFRRREQLLTVAGVGPKSFELAAGFLRIRSGDDPLDASAVHPESAHIVRQMAEDLGCSVSELMGDTQLRSRISLQRYTDEHVGLPTLEDIMKELEKPGRDPREDFSSADFSEGVLSIDDLKPGMQVSGVVTNVTAFGAFVDIGVHKDGLVHISELSDTFVRSPHEVVHVQQQVQVTVLEIDSERKRISLSMKGR